MEATGFVKFMALRAVGDHFGAPSTADNDEIRFLICKNYQLLDADPILAELNRIPGLRADDPAITEEHRSAIADTRTMAALRGEVRAIYCIVATDEYTLLFCDTPHILMKCERDPSGGAGLDERAGSAGVFNWPAIAKALGFEGMELMSDSAIKKEVYSSGKHTMAQIREAIMARPFLDEEKDPATRRRGSPQIRYHRETIANSFKEAPDIGFDLKNYPLIARPDTDIPQEHRAAVVALLEPHRAAGEHPADVMMELAFRDGANQTHRQECKTENCLVCSEALKVRDATRFLRSLMHDAVEPWHTPTIEGLLNTGVNLGPQTTEEAEQGAREQYAKTGVKCLPLRRFEAEAIERYRAQHSEPPMPMIAACLTDLYDRLLYKGGMTFAEMEAPAQYLIEAVRQHDDGPGPARVIVKMLRGVLDRCRLAERERGN